MFKRAYIVVISLAFFSCHIAEKRAEESKGTALEQRVDSVLNLMNLEEKIGQMNQYSGFWDVTGPTPQEGTAAIKYEHLRKGWVGSMINVRGVENVKAVQQIAVEETRLGIPLIIGFDVIHGYKTIAPIPLAEAASWDLIAIEKSAAAAAMESAAAGINWTFAPMVDISRDARWGRVMEGAGEDPYLGSKIAGARVRGFQGEDLAAHNTIVACVKHFAGYGFAESGKDYNTADVNHSTLFNVILPPFEAAKKAGARTFMNSFNDLDGIPATGNAMLQRDLLKGKWAFEGFVVSDWGSISEMIAHGYAKDGKAAAEFAVTAGSDMDMESYLYVEHLAQLVKEGTIKEELIDDAVKRILKVKFELGLFDDPYKYCNEEREQRIIGSQDIQHEALEMAKKSIVLLKNENNLLPLNKQGQRIALIGALGSDKSSPLGNWRLAGKDSTAVSVLEGMKQYQGNELVYAKGVEVYLEPTVFAKEVKINTTEYDGIEDAVQVAKNADVVVMVLGEVGLQSGEGRSRANLDLPGLQQQLLEEVYKVNQNVVLVLNNGRPLAIDWAAEHIPAIVEAWQLGTQSGNAIAQVLYGEYNPSGKLPMTFPRSVGQVPIYYNHKSTGRPSAPAHEVVFWSHYSDESNEPLYPFGYGLSYTSFEYKNLIVQKLSSSSLKVSVDLKNTGEIKGKEVVQLYIRDLFASITRPVKELKGFQLLELNPGETQTVEFILTENELGFYNNQGEYVFEPGTFQVFVGGSSKASLNQKVEL